MTLRVLVVGAGAVGCFYASRLDAGAHVGLVCRSNYEAVRASGVTMDTHTFGSYAFVPQAVYPTVEAAAATPWDLVIVATKALSMDPASVAYLAPVVRDTTTLVLIQNGVDIEAPYRHQFPHTPIVSAVTIVSAAKTEAARIVQYRWTRISLGPYTDLHGSDDASSALMQRATVSLQTLAALLKRGGIPDVEVHDARTLQWVRWHKLCINASMNTTGVLAGGRSNPDMVRDPLLRAHIEACMNEVMDAAPPIFGCSLPFASPERILQSTERNTSSSKSSMVQDWEAGRALELDAILGNAIRIAEAHGAHMPRLQSMYALLQSAVAMRDAAT